MERRSRSQTRRAGEGFAVPGPQGAAGQPGGRHASSGRLPETSHAQLSLPYSRPPEQARTLSPDRRDRYRASYREGQVAGPVSIPGGGGQYPTSNSVPHSNSNSYNQYNQPSYNLNPRYVTGTEQAPPRPLPPSSSGAGGYAAPSNNAPPRPDPPSSTNPYNSTSPNVSPSKASSNLVSQDKAGSGQQQQGLPPPHQVSLIFPGI